MFKIKKKTRNPLRNNRCLRDEIRMSEVILDFAEPLLNHATDLNSKKVAISTAILCWNIYLMPEKKRQEEIGKVADNLFKTGMDRKIFEDMASMLFERKRTFFRDINK